MAKSPPPPPLRTIVEFDDLGEYRLAVVTGFIGKKKLVVVDEEGVERRTPANSVTFEFSRTWDDDDRSKIAGELSRLHDEVETVVSTIRLRPLWDSTVDEGGARAPADLSELLFDRPGEVQTLAMLRALRRDPDFFRERRRGWEPRSAADVERLQRQAANREQERLEREAFVERLATLIETAPVDQEEVSRTMGELSFRQQIQRLQLYACEGDEHEGSRHLDETLDLLEERIGHQLRGYGSLRAFWLNVSLGLFTEHEDLGVRRFQAQRASAAAHARASELMRSRRSPGPERRDFSDWWTCTIDDPSSNDLDDALSIRARADGGWTLAVHIADPSAWVAPGDPLDEYALYASTSLYLPTGSVPMFPREVAEHCMSLVGDHPKPVLTTLFEFSPSLALESFEFVAASITVDRRLSYDEVDAVFQGVSIPDVPVDSLFAMRHIADELMMRRHENGAVELGFPESKLFVHFEDGVPHAEVRFFDGSPARGLVQEMMVATNVAAAEFALSNDVPVLYRVQDPPDGDLEDSEILSIPPGMARELARLKRMRKSVTSVYPGGHAGLGVDGYAQSTSPIRRYSDIVVQRQIKAFVAEEPLPYSESDLVELSGAIERATYDARQVERAAQEYWMTWLLGRAEGPLRAEVIDLRHGRRNVGVFLTEYGYRAITAIKQSVELGEIIYVDVTRADPRSGALSLREA